MKTFTGLYAEVGKVTRIDFLPIGCNNAKRYVVPNNDAKLHSRREN
jgi:hypothetical protein